ASSDAAAARLPGHACWQPRWRYPARAGRRSRRGCETDSRARTPRRSSTRSSAPKADPMHDDPTRIMRNPDDDGRRGSGGGRGRDGGGRGDGGRGGPSGGRPHGNIRLLIACLVAVIVGLLIAIIVVAGSGGGTTTTTQTTTETVTTTERE